VSCRRSPLASAVSPPSPPIQHHHQGLFLAENNHQHQRDVCTRHGPPSLPINTASESAYTYLPSYLMLDVFDSTMVRFDNRSSSCHWSSPSVLVGVERVCVARRRRDYCCSTNTISKERQRCRMSSPTQAAANPGISKGQHLDQYSGYLSISKRKLAPPTIK